MGLLLQSSATMMYSVCPVCTTSKLTAGVFYFSLALNMVFLLWGENGGWRLSVLGPVPLATFLCFLKCLRSQE